MSLDPVRVLDALRSALAEASEAAAWAAGMARDEATSAESRPENQYDTRALEASYLAAGQGERMAEARALAAWAATFEPRRTGRVEAGALVHLSGRSGARWVFLAPRGGPSVDVDGARVTLVSTSSPLGEALVGAESGDEVEVDGPGGSVAWRVTVA